MATIDVLGADEKEEILSYLGWDEKDRRFHRSNNLHLIRDAFIGNWNVATSAVEKFTVRSPQDYDALAWVVAACPRLRGLTLGRMPDDHRFKNGEDPVDLSETRRKRRHGDVDPKVMHELDVGIVGNLVCLEDLDIRYTPLNGSYPCLVNHRRLKRLEILGAREMKFDLGMVTGMPLLEHVGITDCGRISGDIGNLRVLRDTLREFYIKRCYKHAIEGDVMELAGFPRLEVLHLADMYDTKVTGDVRDLRVHHFPAMGNVRYPLHIVHIPLELPSSVYGGKTFERIADASEIMEALAPLQRRSPEMFRLYKWSLAVHSPDRYRIEGIDYFAEYEAPFDVVFVTAGTRLGWRWTNAGHVRSSSSQACEIHWLDPEPSNLDNESPESLAYFRDLELLEQSLRRYRGYLEPPSEQGYINLGMPHFARLLPSKFYDAE